MSEKLLNWARNFEYGAARLHTPDTVDEVQAIVQQSASVKALGTRHSFSDIADTSGDLVSTERLNRVIGIDSNRRTVTVEAGIRYGELSRDLHAAGFALHNLASLPHISVAGACATSTHGSGVTNGSLSTSVSALKFVAANGSIVSLSREQDGDRFEGAVVGLGAFGVVTELTLDIERAFTVEQVVYDNLPFASLEQNFDEIMSCGYSVSLFTHWKSSVVDQVWVKRRVGETLELRDPTSFGAVAADGKRSPLPDGAVENCTEQMGEPGPWYDRLPHFRFGFTPSSGEELQTEYFVAREHAWAALSLINEIRSEVAPLLQTTEIRTIAADSFWMSPSCGRDSVAIHFTWKKDWDGVRRLLPKIEGLLAPFDARPHWGKLSTIEPAVLQARYPALPQFLALAEEYDPAGKFRNAFLDTNVFSLGSF
jgi:xylitol oxidase